MVVDLLTRLKIETVFTKTSVFKKLFNLNLKQLYYDRQETL